MIFRRWLDVDGRLPWAILKFPIRFNLPIRTGSSEWIYFVNLYTHTKMFRKNSVRVNPLILLATSFALISTTNHRVAAFTTCTEGIEAARRHQDQQEEEEIEREPKSQDWLPLSIEWMH